MMAHTSEPRHMGQPPTNAVTQLQKTAGQTTFLTLL